MEYIKIHSLWKRNGWYFDQEKKKSPDYQKGRQSFIIGDYAEEEFGNIKKWHVEEKIDGMNIRVIYNGWEIKFAGRTDDAQLPPKLLSYLKDKFTLLKMGELFPDCEHVIIYGEGYGPKIQNGGSYRKDQALILFDIRVGGWWLKRDDVKSIGEQLLIPMVPEIGIFTEEEIVEYVKSKPNSLASTKPQTMEGIIARSNPLMLFRNGKPILWKLKCKEFN